MVSAKDLEQMLAHRRVVAPGEVIFLEGQASDGAYVVLKGEVQIAINDSGKAPVVLNRMHAGEMFGEIALLQEGQRTATALSEDGCELLVIDKAIFAKLLAEADPFLRFVVDHLCGLVLQSTARARQTR